MQALTHGLSDKDAHDALNNALLKDKGYEEVSFGLLVGILTETQSASKHYRDLTLITRDGFGLILNQLSQLVLERYLRFTDTAKAQVTWIVREMIKSSVSNVDNLCWNLMRHAAGGDTSHKNVTLIESLLDLYIEYRAWLDQFPVLLASVVYTYLRLIEDHNTPYLSALRQKEVNFVVSILRDKFYDCLVIGRDLVRLLQNVARIPEFEQLWKDILLAPKKLCPSFTGVLQLLQMRTSRRFLQSRLTPEMERKLVFFTSQVRFGNHKRYQDWFQRQYLSTPESQSLRCDMIRFIVGVIHPTNELLCSDIIPRWAVIGWLLTTCTSNVAVSNAKLALFYDWLFYDCEKDNIMNIEPAILVMHHSMRSHPAVSATLLDFLCRIITNFYPPLTDKVRAGVFSSLRQILDKRVLPSLLILFDNPKLDRDLRIMVRETFKEFCMSPPNESSSKIDESNLIMKIEESDLNTRLNNAITNHILDNEPAFSDEEEDLGVTIHAPEDDTDDDDIPLAKVKLLKEKALDRYDELDAPIKTCLAQLQTEKLAEKRCEVMETLLHEVCDLDVSNDLISVVAKCICTVLREEFEAEVLPKDVTDKSLSESIKIPVFVIFRTFYDVCKQDDTGKEVLQKLVAEMYSAQTNMGCLLLYFLKVLLRTEQAKEDQSKANSVKISVYKDFCHTVEKKLDVCLYDDLNACHISDTRLMVWIVPDLYKDFKQQTVNNAQILRLIVSVIDAKQLQELVFMIVQGNLLMFKTENFLQLLKTSLSWETIEQFFLWQLIHAHDVLLETITPLIPYLDIDKHAEALTAVTLMLRQEPSADSVKYLFSRDIRADDTFIFTVVKCWCEDYLEKLAEHIFNLVTTRYPATSPNKRKRAAGKSLSTATPAADHILQHLDRLRIQFENQDGLVLFHVEWVQRALHLAQSNSSDSQKKQYSDLFALAEEEENNIGKSRSQGRGRKPAAKPKRPVTKEITDSSEESSEVGSLLPVPSISIKDPKKSTVYSF